MVVTSFIIRRMAYTVLVLFLVSILVFALLNVIPADPVLVMLNETGAPPAQVERLRHQLGLDLPPMVQYFRFVKNALQGDLGRSFFNDRPVVQEIAANFPATLELTVAGLLVAIVLAVPSGVTAAIRRGTWLDSTIMGFSLVGVSMPIFWSGLMLIFLFAIGLGWFPATGVGGIRRLVLPALALGFSSAGMIARLTRSSVLEVLREDFVTTAKAKGLSQRVVIYRHVVRNALIPVVTMMGLQIGRLLGGAVVTETVFARLGIGTMTLNAILLKDLPVAQGAVLLTATGFLLANLLVDIGYAWLDPRIRYN